MRVGVVGAGIVGSSCATMLVNEGHEVTVFEADPDGLSASTGNAALIALPEISPIASPGMLKSVPKWLLDPLGPLTLRWRDVPALTPWLVALLAAAGPTQVARSRAALASLMRTALQDHETLGAIAGLTGHLRQTGFVSVHDNRASLDRALREAGHVRAALGYEFSSLSPASARALVPQLEGPFFGAIHQPAYTMISNPLTVLRHFQSFLRQRTSLVPAKVVGVERQAQGIRVHLNGQADGMFDRVVIAAGIWSRDLVRGLGLRVLLEAERGYNTTYHELASKLPMPLGFPDHGFVATPLSDGLRVGGAVELARPEAPPRFDRAKAMAAKLRRYFPSLPEAGTEWMGCRPSTPDSLPVIGPDPRDDRIIFAFGHGHLGLTLAAVTARMVAEQIAGRSAIPPAFGIQRFQKVRHVA